MRARAHMRMCVWGGVCVHACGTAYRTGFRAPSDASAAAFSLNGEIHFEKCRDRVTST